MNFCLGPCGYDLYAEIHKNYYNQLIHGMFMPFVVYGVFYSLPAVFGKTDKQTAVNMQRLLYWTYVTYYSMFDEWGAVMTAIVYSGSLYFANQHRYHSENRMHDIYVGIGWVLLAVGIQEGFGHTLFEHINSDLGKFPNSVVNAPLFGARSLFHCA